MREAIIVQIRHGKMQWRTWKRISDRDVRKYRLTVGQVVDYVRLNPPPLARLYKPEPTFRVIYEVSEREEVARFKVTFKTGDAS